MEPDDLIDLQEPTSYLAGDVEREHQEAQTFCGWC